MIHIVCPNPAVDRLQSLDIFAPGRVNRVTDVQQLPGGKGMIVARALRRLDMAVTAHGFVGGAPGTIIRDGCAALGIVDVHVEIRGETRVTPVIIERSTGHSTVLNEPGPYVDTRSQEQLIAGLRVALSPGDLVAVTGSLPPGCPDDYHARVVRTVRETGAHVLIDTHGAGLLATLAELEHDPVKDDEMVLVKPNEHELGGILDAAPGDTESLMQAIRALQVRTRATFVVTCGAPGALWVGPAQSMAVDSPVVQTVNPTGSGDSFLAGLCAALAGGESPEQAMMLAAAMGAANAASLLPDVDRRQVRLLRERTYVRQLPATVGGL